jgi:predicted enzyme related to lactoylglutathione lyase
MKRTWSIVGVADVQKSAAWYIRLLNAQNSHPGATSFDQIIDRDGTILVCLHHWGDHGHPSLSNPEEGNPGKGFLLWFVVDDFDTAWEHAQAMGSVIQEPLNTNNGTGMRAFALRDPDGYYVAVNEQRH